MEKVKSFFSDLKKRIVVNKIYICVLVLFFVLAIFLNKPFNKNNNNTIEYYNQSVIGESTPQIVKDVEVRQKFTSLYNGLNKIGIKVQLAGLNANSKANVVVIDCENQK